ncbi:MAG: oxygenase MpaB family protein [Kibdelosporangium sp.]
MKQPRALAGAVDDVLDRAVVGAALMAGGANVIMQLARPGVGHGVVESKVDSGNVFKHPLKRTRTTLTYLAVASFGTDEERRLYRRAVNKSHAQVRSSAASPVQYNAFDPELQLWVAACLYRGVEDTYQAFVGPLDKQTTDALYASSATFGTTLQVPPEMWPADRAAFEEYWTEALDQVHIDDTVRKYLHAIATLKYLPKYLRRIFGPFNKFVTTGFLPPRFRSEMRLDWSAADQHRFDRMTSRVAAVTKRLPGPVRRFPYNLCLWDMRRRIKAGRPLV